jgi:predicted TIM-barrel fold metal-dependent hydrolase
MKAAGFAGCALFSEDPNPVGTLAPQPAPPEEAIDNLFRWIDGAENVFPFYWINPTVPEACDLVDLALSKGVMGFKVLPGTFYPGDSRAIPVYRKIAEAGKPVVFHSGILWDGRYSSCYTRPGNYEALLEVPRLRFALAHVSWPWCDECIAVYGKLLNAYHMWGEDAPEMFIDLAPGTPAIYRRDALTKLFTIGYDVFDHVMFATDCMTPDYGAGWAREWQARDDAIYAELGLSAEQTDSIYRGAFQRFLFGGPNTTRRLPTQLP